MSPTHEWREARGLQKAYAYECGYCQRSISTKLGWTCTNLGGQLSSLIAICPNCDRPTFFDVNGQHPGNTYGENVNNLPSHVDQLYSEIRNCIQVGAFTACALLARKLLMNVAVSVGAKENQPFAFYVDWLSANGYIPPKAKTWVAHLKDKGNEATHEVDATPESVAKDLVSFTSMILRLVFDYPARVPQVATP